VVFAFISSLLAEEIVGWALMTESFALEVIERPQEAPSALIRRPLWVGH
jgi:hypothetical protein